MRKPRQNIGLNQGRSQEKKEKDCWKETWEAGWKGIVIDGLWREGEKGLGQGSGFSMGTWR
jgi:hypothetical protein